MINHTQRLFIGLYHCVFQTTTSVPPRISGKIWNTTLFASSLLLNSPWNLTEDCICCHVCLPWSEGGHFPFSVPEYHPRAGDNSGVGKCPILGILDITL